MAKLVALFVFLGSLCLATVLPANLALAADEDMSSSVYLVFDPETGDFVTVHDPNRTQQNLDAQDPIPADAAPGSSTAPASTSQSSRQGFPLAVGGAIVVALLGGFAWLRRSRRDVA